jgi:hypothetical protein
MAASGISEVSSEFVFVIPTEPFVAVPAARHGDEIVWSWVQKQVSRRNMISGQIFTAAAQVASNLT